VSWSLPWPYHYSPHKVAAINAGEIDDRRLITVSLPESLRLLEALSADSVLSQSSALQSSSTGHSNAKPRRRQT